jgi:hypothetical protein
MKTKMSSAAIFMGALMLVLVITFRLAPPDECLLTSPGSVPV